MVSVDVPRDARSPRGAKLRSQAEAYAAHLAGVKRSRWRLGVRGGWWLIARCGPDTDGWLVLDEQLQAFDDIDPAAERRRVASWLHEVLGIRTAFLWRDYEAAAQGRVAFEVDVRG